MKQECLRAESFEIIHIVFTLPLLTTLVVKQSPLKSVRGIEVPKIPPCGTVACSGQLQSGIKTGLVKSIDNKVKI